MWGPRGVQMTRAVGDIVQFGTGTGLGHAHLRHSIHFAMYGAPAMRLTPYISEAAAKHNAYCISANAKAAGVFFLPGNMEACIAGQHTIENCL